ncbi:nuclease-related domain-containing protein [Georgenia sp. AZ-5]|uniref:nuclease-related domain-containing protein n=1 Tax=Georgenia sp. AZ-5 TaxID=3367526 RepID=UPI0037550959
MRPATSNYGGVGVRKWAHAPGRAVAAAFTDGRCGDGAAVAEVREGPALRHRRRRRTRRLVRPRHTPGAPTVGGQPGRAPGRRRGVVAPSSRSRPGRGAVTVHRFRTARSARECSARPRSPCAQRGRPRPGPRGPRGGRHGAAAGRDSAAGGTRAHLRRPGARRAHRGAGLAHRCGGGGARGFRAGEARPAGPALALSQRGPGTKGSDIDHVVIGPAGVFTVNAKHHPGANVWIAGNTFMVNGARQPYIRNSRHEAARAARLLGAACGFPVPVTPVIAPVGAREITVKAGPEGVAVVARRRLARWIARQREVLDEARLESVRAAARRSTTWTP